MNFFDVLLNLKDLIFGRCSKKEKLNNHYSLIEQSKATGPNPHLIYSLNHSLISHGGKNYRLIYRQADISR